jgi:hypothetical protein
MRIVIETDPSDEGRSTTQAAERQRGDLVLDGGPAPTALLRRFGRLPEARAEAEGEEPGESAQAVLNPLRHGAAVAAHRGQSGGRARVRDETAEKPAIEEGDDTPPEDLDAR